MVEKEIQEKIALLEKENAAMRDGDICPSCGGEFEAGSFKECGGRIIKEAVQLRQENAAMKRVVEAARGVSDWIQISGGPQHPIVKLNKALAELEKLGVS